MASPDESRVDATRDRSATASATDPFAPTAVPPTEADHDPEIAPPDRAGDATAAPRRPRGSASFAGGAPPVTSPPPAAPATPPAPPPAAPHFQVTTVESTATASFPGGPPPPSPRPTEPPPEAPAPAETAPASDEDEDNAETAVGVPAPADAPAEAVLPVGESAAEPAPVPPVVTSPPPMAGPDAAPPAEGSAASPDSTDSAVADEDATAPRTGGRRRRRGRGGRTGAAARPDAEAAGGDGEAPEPEPAAPVAQVSGRGARAEPAPAAEAAAGPAPATGEAAEVAPAAEAVPAPARPAGDRPAGTDEATGEPDEVALASAGSTRTRARRRRRAAARARGRDTDDTSAAGTETDPGDVPAADAGTVAPLSAAGPGPTSPAEAAPARAAGRSRRRGRGGGRAGATRADDASPPPAVQAAATEDRGRPEPAAPARPAGGERSTRLEGRSRSGVRTADRRPRRRPSGLTEEQKRVLREEGPDKRMLVTEGAERTQIGVLEGPTLVEHYVTKKAGRSLVGNIYLGRVQNVLPGMEAAFVDIGRGRNAVLYAGEVNYNEEDLDGEAPRIEKALKAGQSVLVQVTKDPIGAKGARLTAQVSLAGRYLVLQPEDNTFGISRRLPENERTRLREILKEVRPKGLGLIVRTAAEGASADDLRADLARLQARWETVERKAKKASAPAVIYSEPELVVRVIRDIFSPDFVELVVDGDELYARVDEYLQEVAPDLLPKLRRHDGRLPLFEHYRVVEQIHKALERKVWLPSGGSIVIDRTEAMTVVDVNTGKFVGKANLEETVVANNLEAADELVRQLRLRDIGGIIIIDFIDMLFERNQQAVVDRLRAALARDKTKSQVMEVSSLGLVQMTRKRVSGGLLESFSETCPTCDGRGVVITHEI
jgi:ribonuclease E